MSILKPKDGDYIVRGIFLLLGWTCVGWVPFAVLGAILAGAGGAAVGLFIGVIVGIVLFWLYLKLDPYVERPKKPKNCTCGHTRVDHKYGLACHSRYCECYKYKPKPWWVRKSSLDPNNWSV
ncbi:membrane protein [Arthrobacter phage Qui]|uniref:Membrane protein n=1 Tax=Arthrobacter phage Qui TaxID=2603260 RepID=A0A5B8WIR6_9CAUD|nr:membrane protein [Arthrobacter phage Qui]QED11657.1 membrane protein [Arthrobacter phage Qui]QOC56488.1 membrane protein [Arthrobacter phage Paella]